MKNLNILIADDHAIVRTGLATLLESEPGFAVVGEADDGARAVQLARELRPDVVVMDIMMPGTDGIEATREIKRRIPGARVLVLTTSSVSDDLAAALDAGADGIVTKSTANDRLLEAIRTVADGLRFLGPDVAGLFENDPPLPKLTSRQAAILESVIRGFTNADIARQFAIREDSVKEHLGTIFAKLGAANRAEAVGIALRKHLLKI